MKEPVWVARGAETVGHKDVTVSSVAAGLCSGCGVCAAVCPRGALSTQWDEYGQRRPVRSDGCNGCMACLQVCQGKAGETRAKITEERCGDVPGMRLDPIAGYVLSTWSGYSCLPGQRAGGASGGIATWILHEALVRGTIGAAIVVVPGHKEEFEYDIVTTPSELARSQKSKYYPVELSHVLSRVIKGPDLRYGLVALPCMATKIARATMLRPELRRIVLTIGLVCGQLPSRFYMEYLLSIAGVKGCPRSIDFRNKIGTQRAGNYCFTASDENGPGLPVPFVPRAERVWCHGHFVQSACNWCDDVFAEAADVVCMDAWLPEFESDARGHSLLVVRSRSVDGLLAEGIAAGACCARPLSIDRIIESQAGVVHKKRTLLSARLEMLVRRGMRIPCSGVAPSSKNLRRYGREIRLRDETAAASRGAWVTARGDANAYDRLMCSIEKRWDRYGMRTRFVQKLRRLAADPVGVFRRQLRRLV